MSAGADSRKGAECGISVSRSLIEPLKAGKAAGFVNILAELVKHGREAVIDVITRICNKIWQTGEWPTRLTQLLLIMFPKKGN